MVREAASKRYKEGPVKMEEKINLFDKERSERGSGEEVQR